MARTASTAASAGRSETFPAPFLLAAGTMGEVMTRTWIEWQREVTRFAGARMEEDLMLARSLSECRNLGEVLKLQQQWAAETLKAYASETGELLQIATRAAQDGIPSVEVAEERRAA